MGANNSIPQIIRVRNPERRESVEVSPSVVTRLENAQRQSENKSNRKMPEKEQQQQEQQLYQQKQKHRQQGQLNQHPYKNNQHYKRNLDEWTHKSDVLLDRAFNELEEQQFEKTKEKCENEFGKPLEWTNNIEGEIVMLRNELIACYRENPGEPLCCAELAERFQELIFREQFSAILKFNRKTYDDERESERCPSDEAKYFSQRRRV
uniref:Uncharacterized protein n=1 Tax=Glossina palpalis gambiensis TaxID=67801 RepID=A0A1B0BHG4_9MUSC